MASGNPEQTRKILIHHWQAFGAGDVEAIMADYADDAVLITPEGTRRQNRRANIRSSAGSEINQPARKDMLTQIVPDRLDDRALGLFSKARMRCLSTHAALSSRQLRLPGWANEGAVRASVKQSGSSQRANQASISRWMKV